MGSNLFIVFTKHFIKIIHAEFMTFFWVKLTPHHIISLQACRKLHTVIFAVIGSVLLRELYKIAVNKIEPRLIE